MSFSEESRGLIVLGEKLVGTNFESPAKYAVTYFARSSVHAEFGAVYLGTKDQPMTFPPGESFLSQFKNPADTTPMTQLGQRFSQIRIFREFRTGPGSPSRYGISTAATKDALVDGSDNLALVLHELDFLGVHDRIADYLRRFCGRFEDVKINVGEGLARIYLREDGLTEMH